MSKIVKRLFPEYPRTFKTSLSQELIVEKMQIFCHDGPHYSSPKDSLFLGKVEGEYYEISRINKWNWRAIMPITIVSLKAENDITEVELLNKIDASDMIFPVGAAACSIVMFFYILFTEPESAFSVFIVLAIFTFIVYFWIFWSYKKEAQKAFILLKEQLI